MRIWIWRRREGLTRGDGLPAARRQPHQHSFDRHEHRCHRDRGTDAHDSRLAPSSAAERYERTATATTPFGRLDFVFHIVGPAIHQCDFIHAQAFRRLQRGGHFVSVRVECELRQQRSAPQVADAAVPDRVQEGAIGNAIRIDADPGSGARRAAGPITTPHETPIRAALLASVISPLVSAEPAAPFH